MPVIYTRDGIPDDWSHCTSQQNSLHSYSRRDTQHASWPFSHHVHTDPSTLTPFSITWLVITEAWVIPVHNDTMVTVQEVAIWPMVPVLALYHSNTASPQRPVILLFKVMIQSLLESPCERSCTCLYKQHLPTINLLHMCLPQSQTVVGFI